MGLSDLGKKMVKEWGESLTWWEKFALTLAWLIPLFLLNKKSKQKIFHLLVEPTIKETKENK